MFSRFFHRNFRFFDTLSWNPLISAKNVIYKWSIENINNTVIAVIFITQFFAVRVTLCIYARKGTTTNIYVPYTREHRENAAYILKENFDERHGYFWPFRLNVVLWMPKIYFTYIICDRYTMPTNKKLLLFFIQFELHCSRAIFFGWPHIHSH